MEIMIVDDHEDVRTFIKEMLSKNGHNVMTAKNGKEAIDRLVTYKVDLIITDIVMPEIEGVEFILRLRQSNVPIISISGLTKENIISSLLSSLGIVGFLQKPFNKESLMQLITNVQEEIKLKSSQ